MKEIGIDMSNQYSKSIDEFKDMRFDIVVTVCKNAKETCPFFPGKKVIHKEFDDPDNFCGSITEKLEFYQKIGDEIKTWIVDSFGEEKIY